MSTRCVHVFLIKGVTWEGWGCKGRECSFSIVFILRIIFRGLLIWRGANENRNFFEAIILVVKRHKKFKKIPTFPLFVTWLLRKLKRLSFMVDPPLPPLRVASQLHLCFLQSIAIISPRSIRRFVCLVQSAPFSARSCRFILVFEGLLVGRYMRNAADNLHSNLCVTTRVLVVRCKICAHLY